MSTFGTGAFGSGTFGDPTPIAPGLPTAAIPLPVIVTRLTIGATTRHISDIEYGDAGTNWHDARLTGDIAYSRGIGCVLWGQRRGASGGLGNIEMINDDGELDALITGSQADATVGVFVVDQDQPMSAATAIAAAVVTAIAGRGEQTARIVTGDIMSRLDVPLQSSLYASGDGVATLNGRPRPWAAGNPLSCPIVLVDDVDYDYDCHDSDAHTIVTVRDMGYPLALGTDPGDGYKIATDTGIHGITLLQQPIGRVVADVSATSFTAESIIGAAEGDFATDIADWTDSVTGDATAAWDGVGAAELTADATSAAARAELEFPTALVAGQTYTASADVDLTTVTGTPGYAGVQVFFRPDSLAAPNYIRVGLRSTAGTESFSRTFTAPESGHLVIECVASAGATIEALIDNVRLDRVSAGGDVADVIEQLLARAGIGSDQIDTASIEALRTARPWAVSYWADGAESIGDVLQQVLDSVFGGIYINALGQIAVGILQPPGTLTPVLEITQDDFAGDIDSDPDHAPGLSTTVAGARNWYKYGEGELADAISDADRALLTADYRIRCTAADPVGIELGPRAGAAVSDLSKSGIATLLDQEVHIQAAADLLPLLYPPGDPRRFYKLPVFLTRVGAAALNPYDEILVTHERFGFAAGVPLVVFNIESIAGEDLVVLHCWGSSNE